MRQMHAMASTCPWYMQVRICICLLTVSSGKHTEAASRPEAAPSPRLCTVNVLHSQQGCHMRSSPLRPEIAHATAMEPSVAYLGCCVAHTRLHQIK